MNLNSRKANFRFFGPMQAGPRDADDDRRTIGSWGGESVYICNDTVCDPICDFCWYCIQNENGEPVRCNKMKPDFENGIGYCDCFRCKLHESMPHDY